MGLEIKRNRQGEYNLKSSISGEQLHEKNWITEKEVIKLLIERQFWKFAEESIKIFMEFPSGYHVNGRLNIIKEKHSSGLQWIVDNWGKQGEKFDEICRELNITISTLSEMEEIKRTLDMGFEVRSPRYILNTTNWGKPSNPDEKQTKFECALSSEKTGKTEYYYDNEDDDSYKEAVQIIIDDLKKGW